MEHPAFFGSRLFWVRWFFAILSVSAGVLFINFIFFRFVDPSARFDAHAFAFPFFGSTGAFFPLFTLLALFFGSVVGLVLSFTFKEGNG